MTETTSFNGWLQQAIADNPTTDPRALVDYHRQTYGYGPNEEDYAQWAGTVRGDNPGATDDDLRQYYVDTYGELDTNAGALGDLGTRFVQGIARLPGAITGLADLANPLTYATGHALFSEGADWLGEKTGFQPAQWAEGLNENLSPAGRRAQADIEQAWDTGSPGEIAASYFSNPVRAIGGLVAESIPLTLAGGMLGRGAAVAGRALQAGEGAAAAKAGQVMERLAPGIGEGAIAGGAVNQALLDQGVDPRTAGLTSLGAGITTGALGMLGANVAARAKLTDIEAAMAGTAAQAAQRSFGTRVLGGAAIEGLVEELPQSITEQMWQNIALGNPLTEGVGRAGVEGVLAGSAMGGVFNAMPQGARVQNGQSTDLTSPPDSTPPVTPDQLGLVPGVGLQQSIDARMGTAPLSGKARKQYEQDLLKAFNEPAGFRIDENQVEQPLTAYEAMYRQATGELPPTPAPEAKPAKLTPEQKKARDAATQQERAQQEWAAKVASVSPEVQDLATNENLPIRDITAAEKYWNALQTWDEKRLATERTKLSDVDSRAPAWKSTLLGLFDDQTQANTVEDTLAPPAPRPEDLARWAQGVQETPIAETGVTTGETVQATQETPDTGAEPTQALVPTQTADIADVFGAIRTALTQQVKGRGKSLSPKEQETIALRLGGTEDGSDMTFDAIAQQRGTSRQSVQAQFERGLTKLREHPALKPYKDQITGILAQTQQGTGDSLQSFMAQNGADQLDARNTETTNGQLVDTAALADGTLVAKNSKSELGLTDQQTDVTGGSTDAGATRSAREMSRRAREELSKNDALRTALSEPGRALVETHAANPIPAPQVEDPENSVPGELVWRQHAQIPELGAMSWDDVPDSIKTWFGNKLQDPNQEITQAWINDTIKTITSRLAPRTERAVGSGQGDTAQGPARLSGPDGSRATSGAGVKNAVLQDTGEPQVQQRNPEGLSPEIGEIGPRADERTFNLTSAQRERVNQVEQVAKGSQDTYLRHRANQLMEDYRTNQDAFNGQNFAGFDDIQRQMQRFLDEASDTTPATQKTLDKTGGHWSAGRIRALARALGMDVPESSEFKRSKTSSGQLYSTYKVEGVPLKAKAAGEKLLQIANERLARGEPVDLASLATARNNGVIGGHFVVTEGDTKTKYGEAQATQATTRQAFNQALTDLLGRADSWRVHLYDTAEQAQQAGIPKTKLAGTSGRGAYGWVETKNGKTHATFILENIQAGTETGKILHELGAHIGMEGALNNGQLQILYDKIAGWAALENSSQESQIAQAALARVAQAKTEGTQQQAETIAYFVEEAVKAGINPTAMSHKGELARWFRTLWAAFKTALRKLGVRNIDSLTAQHVVDLAHGAAKLELTGQWHGTPETFRVFNSSAAPLGNASAQGRGTYTTTSEATARDYAQDGGNLLRTDSPIPRDRLLVWNAPISAQPQPVQDALTNSGLVSDARTTGREAYESARAMLGDKGAADLFDALGIHGTVQGDTTAVFNDKNILTIGRAPGGDLSQIRYGEPGWAPTKVIQDNISKLPGPVQDATKAIVETAKAAARKTHLGLASTKDLADYISDKAAPFKGVIKEYMTNVQAAKVERTMRDKVASDILARYHALKLKPVQKSVADFLAKARIEEKWGYDPQAVTVTNPEAWQPAGYQKGERVTVDPAMRDAFERLTPEAQRVVVDINKTLSDNFRTTQELIEKNVVDVYDKRIAQTDEALAAATDAKVIKRLEKRLAALKADKESTLKSYGKRLIATKAPYAPLKRDGKYVVQAHSDELKALYDKGENRTAEENKRYNTLRRDENHYRLEFVNSRFEIEQRKRLLAETFGENVDAWEKTSWRENTFVGLPEIDRLRSLVQEGVVDDSAAKLSRAVEKLALQVMVDTHARQSQHQAKKIPGYDPDMVRSFISQARADAHNLANLKYLSEINDTIQRMTRMVEDKDVRAQTGLTRDELGNMVSELHQRWGDTLKYQPSPVVDRLAAFSSTWHLLMSPAYYFQNATQVGMMSVPWMAGTHGWTKTQQAVLRAYRDILPMVKDKAASWEHFNTELVPEDVRAVIKSLELSGQINIFMDLELGQAAATGDGVGAKVGRSFDQTVRRLPAKMETINRVVTAIAAYRLAMEKENNVAKATEYAGKVIDITHGDYDGFNTPRWISPGKWGPTAKLVFQFRKFQLIQLAFYTRMLNDMTASHPPEVRKAAAKALGFSLAHTTALAGTLGLPGLMTAQFLASLIGGDDDEPDDKDAQDFRLRKALIDGGMSPGLVDVVLGGLPTLVGVDMTSKLGSQTLLSPLPYTEIAPRKQGNFQTIVADSLGPTVGLADKFYRAFGDFQRGDYYAALEKAMPTGIGGDTVQAIRLMDKGERTYNSDQAFSPEELGLATAIFTGLGFTPEILSKRWTKLRVQKSYEGTFDQRTTDIKRAYSAAVNDGASRKAIRRIKAEWMDLQKAKKAAGFRDSGLGPLLRAPMEQRKRERQTLGGVKYDRGSRGFVEETNRVIGG